MTTPHVSNRLPRDLGCACVKMAGKVMDEHVMVSCLKRFSFHLCDFLRSFEKSFKHYLFKTVCHVDFKIDCSLYITCQLSFRFRYR